MRLMPKLKLKPVPASLRVLGSRLKGLGFRVQGLKV